MRGALFVLLSAFLTSCSAPPSGAGNHEYVETRPCSWDFSNVDFCDAAHVTAIKDALKRRSADYFGRYIFVAVSSRGTFDRSTALVVDVTTGVAYPLPFDYFGGHVDKRGFPVESKVAQVSFNASSDQICIDGSVYAYRNITENQVICYKFDGSRFSRIMIDPD